MTGRENADVPSDLAQARRRSRAVLLGGSVGAALKLITLSVTFVLTPVTLARAGLTTFGLFVALTAFSSLLSFTDLGLANGLMARLGEARAKADRRAAAAAVSNTLALLISLGLLICTAGAVLAASVPWAQLLNADPARAAELTQAVLIIAVSLAIGLPGGLATKILMALLRPAAANAWNAVGLILSASLVTLAAGAANPLPYMVAAQVAIPGIWGLAALAYVVRRDPFLHVSPRLISFSTMVGLLRLGRLFVFLQLAAVLSYQIDALVIVRILGPVEAAVFATTLKFVSFPLGFASFYFLPLWPAFADAHAKGDRQWIRGVYYRTRRLAVVAGVGIAALIWLGGSAAVDVWTNGAVQPSSLLVIAGSAWVIVSMLSQPQAMLLNGLHIERFQVKIVSLTVLVNICLSVFLTFEIGNSGTLFGTVASLLVCTIIPSTIWIGRHFRAVGVAG